MLFLSLDLELKRVFEENASQDAAVDENEVQVKNWRKKEKKRI